MQRTRILISALAVLGLLALAPASLGPMKAGAATPTPEAPPATLEAVLQAGLDRGLTGLALRVERGDAVLFDRAAGFASFEHETPLAPTDRFGIGSVTKTFAAVLVLQLVDAGVLTLDDTVSRWLDDPVAARIPNVDRITLRQLLNHTSGVYDYFDDDSPFWQDAYFGEGADWSRVWTPQELLAYADGSKHAPYFAPGEGVHYSNTGYVLLGLIVEAAGGHGYAEQLRAGLLAPLGLADTFFAAAEPVPGGRVDAYHLIEGGLVNVSAIHPSALWTAGGMVSTTRDLARFADALFGGELLRPATLEEMVTFLPVADRPGFEVGMGVFRRQTPGGDALVGNSGDGPGAGARMYRLADADLTVVLLTNTGGDEETVDALFAEAVGAARGTEAPTD
jgi:D-alanyl-D-alanine carboxypeptidase